MNKNFIYHKCIVCGDMIEINIYKKYNMNRLTHWGCRYDN